MKTSALAAQFFEPATAQTGKSGLNAGAAEFAQVLAKARQVGFAPTLPDDGGDLMAKAATRRSEPAPRAERPAETDSRAEARRSERQSPRTDSADQVEATERPDDTAAAPAEEQPADEPAVAADDGSQPAAAADDTEDTVTTAAAPTTEATATTTTTEAPTTAAVASSGADTAAETVAVAATTAEAAPEDAAEDAAAADQRMAADAARSAAARRNDGQAQPADEAAAEQPGQEQATASTATTAAAANPAAQAAARAAQAGGASGNGTQRQAAELAGLASGVGITVRSGPTAGPQTDLVAGGALMAQSVDGDAAIEAALMNGDAAEQFLMGGDQAGGSLAAMLGRLEQTTASTLAAGKAFAAEAGVQGTTPAGGSAAQPVAGLGAASATGSAHAATAAQSAAPAHAAQQPTPVQQVSTALANAVAKGQDSISIQLSPDDLGKIDIKLDFSGDKVSATIVADKPETLEMLQKDSRTLERMLSDAGLQTDQQSLNFSLRGERGNAQAGRDERSGRSRAQLLALDDGGPETAAAPLNRARTTVGGIDISV